MKDPGQFLLDGANGGVYAAPASVAALRDAAMLHGLAWFALDLGGVHHKAALLARCRTAFSLPQTFGHNWDALADCLEDLAWHPARGYVVHCHDGGEFARRAPADYATALEILGAAAMYWRERERLFMVLLDASTRGTHDAPPLPVAW